MKYFKIIILFLLPFSVFAQEPEDSYLHPREYIIDNIIPKNNQAIEDYTIISWSGLEKGGRLRWPGDQISVAIKKLWNQGAFDDIEFKYEIVEGNKIVLYIYVKERPRLKSFSIIGVRKTPKKEIIEKINLQKDRPVTPNLIATTETLIKRYFEEKGRANCEVQITQIIDSVDASKVYLKINIDKGEKVKIQDIIFSGNIALGDAKLRKLMKETKRYRWWNVFKDGAFSEKDYTTDLATIISKYNEKGFRDARIVSDSVIKLNPSRKLIKIQIDEGTKFYFRNINWVGNTKYSTEELNRILNIKRGDVYNMQNLNSKLMMDANGQDVSSLYLDDGYLFFNINPKETKIEGDSIDIEIRIYEGKQARIRNVTLVGNTKTSDYVVMREIRTKPGDLFRRSDIIRSQRELAQLKYFNPEKMAVNPKPNPADGTVDIEYVVEEQPSDQVELSAGYGANRLIGTLGLSFNNFSTKRILKRQAWTPLPSGDGQTLSIRAQSTGLNYQSYNLSFIEPWLGGKKPNSLSVSFSHSRINTFNSAISLLIPSGHYYSTTGTVGYGQRLKWPDDFFSWNHFFTYQHYDIFNYSGATIPSGQYNAWYYKMLISRNSIDQPIYPRSGSNINFTFQVTPPWSKISPDMAKRLNLLEYYKIKFQAEFYHKIVGNLVLYSKMNFGVLGRYNAASPYTSFERFYLGGSPMSYNIDGREVISLRGYTADYGTNGVTPKDGAVAAVKYTMELRYPVSLNPSATIYALAFAEAGRGWSNVRLMSPFEPRKSVGAGVRIFMPMFGLLGVDIGYGFDNINGIKPSPGWQPTFMLGYSMSNW